MFIQESLFPQESIESVAIAYRRLKLAFVESKTADAPPISKDLSDFLESINLDTFPRFQNCFIIGSRCDLQKPKCSFCSTQRNTCQLVTLKILKANPQRVLTVFRDALKAVNTRHLPPEEIMHRQQQIFRLSELLYKDGILPRLSGGVRVLSVGFALEDCRCCKNLKESRDKCDRRTPACTRCLSLPRECVYDVRATTHLESFHMDEEHQSQQQEHPISNLPGPLKQTNLSHSQAPDQGMSAENFALLQAFVHDEVLQNEHQLEQHAPFATPQASQHAATSHPSHTGQSSYSDHATKSTHPTLSSSSKGKRSEQKRRGSGSEQEPSRRSKDSKTKSSKRGRTGK